MVCVNINLVSVLLLTFSIHSLGRWVNKWVLFGVAFIDLRRIMAYTCNEKLK